MSYPFRCAALATVLLVGCNPNKAARNHVAAAIREEFGSAANPRVSALRDSTHLFIQLDTVLFAHLADSAFAIEARKIASLALREYANAELLDSITVATVSVPNHADRGNEVTEPDKPLIFRPPDPVQNQNVLLRVNRHRTFAVPEIRP